MLKRTQLFESFYVLFPVYEHIVSSTLEPRSCPFPPPAFPLTALQPHCPPFC